MGYSHERTLTIDHTQVGSSDSTDFPVLFAGTYSWLATIANAGLVHSSSGYDIIFASDAAGTAPLSFERVGYDPTTGLVEFWVKVATVSHTSDTVIYILYGNSAVSTDQQDANGTWNSATKLVYHLPDGTTLTANDSTSNANNASALHSTSAAAGQIGGAASFDGSSNYIKVNNTSSLDSGSLTISMWVKAQTGMAQFARMIEKGDNNEWTVVWNYTAGSNKLGIQALAGSSLLFNSSGVLADNAWHKIDVSFPAGPGSVSVKLYVDGGLDTSGSTSGISGGSNDLYIGARGDGSGTLRYHGLLDEVRISNVVRSADWLLAEYNNQKSASTLVTVGSQTTPPGSGNFQPSPSFVIT